MCLKPAIVGTRLLCAGVVASATLLFPAHGGLSTTAYYAAWMQDHLPAGQVDFSALTQIIHFAVVPNRDGTLDSEINLVTQGHSTDLVAGARAAGTKVLISIGGGESAAGFRGACSSANLSNFISNIVTFTRSRGYDGVDLDWEPLAAEDAAQYTDLVNGLRSALDAYSPRPLLTAAVASQAELLAGLQHQFDQISLMNYDLSGPWEGWVTWFNSPLFDGGYRFLSTGALVPSTEGMVGNFIAAGVSPQKMAIGIDFYGRVWSGGTGTTSGGVSLPRQRWTTAPSMAYTPYHVIMADYYQPQRHAWDEPAQAAYLSIDHAGAANDKFISYDDPATCRAKVQYAMRRGLGGVMIFELGGGYRPDQPEGLRDPLLQAVKKAVSETSRITDIPTKP